MKKRIYLVFLIGMFLVMINFVSAACPAGFPAGAICSESDTTFEVRDRLLSCEYDEDHSWWVNSTQRYTVKLGDAPGMQCKLDQSLIALDSNVSCCPIGSVCEKIVLGDYRCVPSSVQFCHDYETSENCNSFVEWVPEESFKAQGGSGYTGFCKNPQTAGPWKNTSGADCWSIKDACACVWEDSACTNKVYNQTYCGDDFITVGSCSYKLTKWEDKCDIRGFIVASWNATSSGIPMEDCVDIVDQDVPCSSITRLPFFGLFSFITSCLAIIGIYCFILRKNEN